LKNLAEKIEEAIKILKSWKTAARLKGNKEAERSAQLILDVIHALTGKG
jgi:hypothetical protein